MDAFALMMTFIFVGFASSSQSKPESIRKCCPKGMQFDTNAKFCSSEIGMKESKMRTEVIEPPISYTIYSWIPNNLHNETVVVNYDALPDVKLDVSVIYDCSDTTILYSNLKEKIHNSLINEMRYCYDRSPEHACVLFKSVKLKPMYKCCPKGTLLNTDVSSCQVHTSPHSSITEEVSQFVPWLPLQFSQYTVRAQYNYFQTGLNFNIKILNQANLRWNLEDTGFDSDTKISYRGINEHGEVVSGSTTKFCFDEVENGAIKSQVLLVADYHVPKCCAAREHLSDMASACLPWSEAKLRSGDMYRKPNINDMNWLINIFPYNDYEIRYNTIFKMSQVSSKLNMFPENSILGLDLNNDTHSLTIKLKDGQREIILDGSNYCFDHLAGSGKVIVMHPPKPKNYDPKCVHSEVELGKELDKYIVVNHLRTFPLAAATKPAISNCTILSVGKTCRKMTEEVHFDDVSVINKLLEEENDTLGQDESYECVPGKEESITEAVPSCSRRSRSEDMVRVAGVAGGAAVVAAAAAVLAIAQKRTRRLAHGRALAFHALCCAIANGLQATSFLEKPVLKSRCIAYMYFTYFFMVSSNFWLTAISYNIFQTFRLSLGELASTCRSKVQAKKFVTMNLIGWGGGTALTVFAIIMHQSREQVRPLGVLTPYFSETRTCAYEYEFETDDDTGVYLYDYGIRAVCYHCIPTGMLGILNVVLVVLAAYKLHVLRRGSSILQKAPASFCGKDINSERPPPQLVSALFYLKLLMTTGVVQIALETANWARGHQKVRYYVLNETIIVSYDKLYTYGGIGLIVDLVRAIIVLWMTTGRFWRVERGWAVIRNWIRTIQKWKELVRVNVRSRMKVMRISARSGVYDNKDEMIVLGEVVNNGRWKEISFK